MSLSSRLQKVEKWAAPIKAEQERKRKNAEVRAEIFKALESRIQESLAGYRYVLGDGLNEEETTKDIVELDILYHGEATDRFGTDEKGFYKATPEQLNELCQELTMRFDRDFFGNHQTVEQHKKEQEQWRQVRADMEAGVASAESEAAEYIRQLYKRYPRKANAERFYNIWD